MVKKIMRRIKKIKRVKKIKRIKRKKRLKTTKRPLRRANRAGLRKRKTIVKKEEIIGSQEMAIERLKFYIPAPAAKPMRVTPQELPGGYEENRIILQVRDPRWLHSYWDVTPDKWEDLKGKLGEAFYTAKKVLRVYDISQIIFDGKNAHRFFDIEISPEANNWYINTGGPGRSWCVDLGLRLASGEFIMLIRSNTVHTPLDGPSWITDEEWMIPEDMFARLYGMGFGLGTSSPVGKAWQERVKKGLFSGALASGRIASGPAVKKKTK